MTQVQAFVNGVMRIFAKAPILAVGGLIMAIALEPGLSVVLAVAVPLCAALITVNLLTGFPRFRRMQEGLDGVNSVTREYLGGVRVVKAFGQEKREVRRFAAANGELTAASTFALRIMAFFGPTITLIMNLGIVLVLWIGGFRVAGSSLQVGKIIAFINYMTQILFSLTMISGIITSFVRAKASWDRVGAILGTLRERDLRHGARPRLPLPRQGRPSVRFSGVSFAYPASQGRLVLEGVDLECEPGRHHRDHRTHRRRARAASYPSCRASTSPRAGAVSMGGTRRAGFRPARSARSASPLCRRRRCSSPGTIAENLRWGKRRGDRRGAGGGGRTARAHEFITGFPEGYRERAGPGRGEPLRRAEAAPRHCARAGEEARRAHPG